MASPHSVDLQLENLRAFRVIFGAVRQQFQQIDRSCGINGAQVWALKCICERAGLRVTELAQALAIHQSTASNVVAALSRRGLIERQRLAADQRVVILRPTREGCRLIAQAPEPAEGVLPAVLADLDTEQLLLLQQGLSAVIAKLNRAERGSPNLPLATLRQPL